MKAYKRLATLAPMAVLSTSIFCSPAMTFAAEKTTITKQTAVQQNVVQKGRTIQGYLIKNGKKTPIYKESIINNQTAQSNDAPYPQLSSNPNDAIPITGATHSENGSIGSVLYFSKAPFYFSLDIKLTNLYIEKNNDGTITRGKYDPKTLKRTPLSGTMSSGDPDYARFNAYFKGTTTTRDTFFSKIGSGVVPKNSSYTFSQAVTSGLTTADAIGGAVTLGYTMSLTEGGGIFPAAASEEFSSQLTASYEHTITVSSEVTNTQTLGIPQAADSYQYDKYAAAVYQLRSKYKMNPSAKLREDLANGTVVLDTRAQSFQYDDSTLYLAVTPGAGI
ncbi:hypothetical protein COJ60_26145 [Bacillus cereus]|uniref:hypothetical protein n=1 Tax=Bacillus TaxID=1386 RepID=UPI000BF6443B|nr:MULTISPECIES: hypothetical protein [Bacillus cereus group]PFN31093.1 hypothetical protein COJ60_26145 [Bacillus cereus]MCU5208678.1 hypothetical protein [Bacillus paranthracis]MDA2164043.1 hypothetical protein [Bacillus cereus group sp. Bc252]MDF9513113.1 hypothetical protein [Bacillus paranthracis]MDF9672204.1 hypothetical protein [Bacillus paranthracis]